MEYQVSLLPVSAPLPLLIPHKRLVSPAVDMTVYRWRKSKTTGWQIYGQAKLVEAVARVIEMTKTDAEYIVDRPASSRSGCGSCGGLVHSSSNGSLQPIPNRRSARCSNRGFARGLIWIEPPYRKIEKSRRLPGCAITARLVNGWRLERSRWHGGRLRRAC